MTRLEPSFRRVLLRVGLMTVVVSVFGYFMQGLQDHLWWSLGYIESLAIPLAFMPVAVWFMFVPKTLEYSEAEIIISTLIGTGSYRWEDLDSFGPGENVFMIQFEGDRQAYQIASFAYSKEDWNQFLVFLKSHYPEKEARMWIGAKLFRSNQDK